MNFAQRACLLALVIVSSLAAGEDKGDDDISWASTSLGRVAVRKSDCPSGTSLLRHGTSQPSLPGVVSHLISHGIIRERDPAIHAGCGNGHFTLELAHLLKGGSIIAIDGDTLPLSRTLSLPDNAAQREIIKVLRSRVVLPANLSSDQVFGEHPPCMGGYVGTADDDSLLPTPIDVIACHNGIIPRLVVVSLPPAQVRGALLGLSDLLSSPSAPPPVLILHADYDPQAGVLEPLTHGTIEMLQRTWGLTVYLHIGKHGGNDTDLARAQPPLHIIALRGDIPGWGGEAKRVVGGGMAVHVGGGEGESGAGGQRINPVFKRMFVGFVPDCPRLFGTNKHMMFRRLTNTHFPLATRSNLASKRGFPSGGIPQRRALYQIGASQQAQDCASSKLLVLRYINGELAGHGSLFGHLATALGLAYVTGRVLVIDEGSPWPFKDECVREGACHVEDGFMATYFEPISNCQPPLPGSVPEVEITGEPEDDEHRVLYVSNDRVLPRFRTIIPNEMMKSTPPDESSLLWWFSNLVSFALRPNKRLLAMVASHRAHLPERYIGMHVRRGHKWVETPSIPLQDFIKTASNISIATGVKDVLVVTEDGQVEKRLRAMNPPNTPPGQESLTFHFTNHTRKGYRVSIPQALRLGLLSAGKENEVSLVNLFLLKEAQAIIGSFSSGYSKRALELQTAHNDMVPIYLSMDNVWGP